jgi:hypothetical protein
MRIPWGRPDGAAMVKRLVLQAPGACKAPMKPASEPPAACRHVADCRPYGPNNRLAGKSFCGDMGRGGTYFCEYHVVFATEPVIRTHVPSPGMQVGAVTACMAMPGRRWCRGTDQCSRMPDDGVAGLRNTVVKARNECRSLPDGKPSSFWLGIGLRRGL